MSVKFAITLAASPFRNQFPRDRTKSPPPDRAITYPSLLAPRFPKTERICKRVIDRTVRGNEVQGRGGVTNWRLPDPTSGITSRSAAGSPGRNFRLLNRGTMARGYPDREREDFPYEERGEGRGKSLMSAEGVANVTLNRS